MSEKPAKIPSASDRPQGSLLVASLESLGTLDGPGIRTVFFLQGCPLRCAYCHNPETQAISYLDQDISERHAYCPAHNGNGPAGWMNWDRLFAIARRYRPYHGKKGGLTFSGGEALMQIKVLNEFFPRLKAHHFNLCLDTSGFGASTDQVKQLLPHCDYILLDLKAENDAGYRELCKVPLRGLRRFIDIAADDTYFQGELILRHVAVPGISDSYTSLPELVELSLPIAKKVSRLEILPYHSHGAPKYEVLGIDYPLKSVPDMDADEAKRLEIAWQDEFKKRCQDAGIEIHPNFYDSRADLV
ncbi:MAG: radical SAM protein [Eubacteriales bacterium]|nr:radical SAM protein [Eubacteriales bacterium]